MLTRTFLKNGETLKPVQRAGVLVISSLIIGWGIYFASDALDAIHNGSPRYFLTGGQALFLVIVGTLGVRNGLRFKERKPRD